MADQMETAFKWTIKNFDMCHHLCGKYFESPKFNVGSCQFRLRLFPNGLKEAHGTHTSAFLVRPNNCGKTHVFVNFELYLIDHEGLPRNVCKCTDIEFKNRSSWGWGGFIEKDRLLSTARRELLPNNNLTIGCKVSSLSVKESEEDEKKLYNEQDVELLSRDFAKLLQNGIHADMGICVGDSKFKVHAAILSCRCPQLMAHLKETGAPNEYSLPDIEESELRTLLQYLYTGTFSDSNMCKKILIAADTFNLPVLRNALTFPYNRSSVAITNINVSRVSFRWIIADFSKLQMDKELVYPAFCYTDRKWDEMKILLSVKQSESGSKCLELKFQKVCSNAVPFMRCKISLYKSDKPVDPVCIKEYEHMFENENWVTPLGLETELGEMFKDTLNMFFEISITNKEETSKIEEVSIESKTQKAGVSVVKKLQNLQRDFKNLYWCLASSDITLCVDDTLIPAHKAVFCARSPVFAKMFEHDTLEKQSCEVSIPDLDLATVSSMLLYIYCGYINDMNIPKAIKIYGAADKYELLSLKEKCATFLQSSIHPDYVGDILLLADAHHDESLKKCVYDYMMSNPEEVLLSKNGLSTLNKRLDVYPDILKALLQRVSSMKK